MKQHPRRAAAIFLAALVVAALGALGLRAVLEGRAARARRAVLEGRAALAAGDEAHAGKRTTEAIAAWETAARWYLPGAPHVDEAYARLVHLATSESPHALTAWRAVRSAARATRSLWTPHADDLADADAAIAKRSADDPEASLAGGPDHAARVAWHREALARDPRPRGGAATLAVFGLVAWVAGIGALARRGLDDAGRLVRRPALRAAALALAGLAAWAIGLYAA